MGFAGFLQGLIVIFSLLAALFGRCPPWSSQLVCFGCGNTPARLICFIAENTKKSRTR
jgi:hypothetical protein